MPLIDMAEAVSRGDIIVDEVDALNAVNSGKLSEIETARFSPLVIEHSRRQSGGTGSAINRADPLQNLDGIELGDTNGTTGSDDEHAWNNVLVDEVDFVHAVERGRINRNDLHIMGCRSNGDTWIPQRMVDDVEEFGDISHSENGWNRVLVDEIDILHAVEQRSRIVNRSECRLTYMHRENGTERLGRNNDIVQRAESAVNGESSFEIGRTVGTGRPSRGKQ
ncbi:hypothetical protein ACH3XW_39075 [Acanthocheilonema viteae]|uniref:Uncharacterized protein n=1 Tax=Acanthocheilonema viteae TaxID=6277 RepID=A0A498S295_ACAVI|nr:unnamed protein product [Acanthocheilonema viteae]